MDATSINRDSGTPRRVKVNLNESFNASINSPCDKNILNYSIVESNVDEDNIKLKLKLSRTSQQPKVLLEPLNPNVIEHMHNMQNKMDWVGYGFEEVLTHEQGENQQPKPSRRSTRPSKPVIKNELLIDESNLRRSSRVSSRISYTEHIIYSPRKSQLRSKGDDESLQTTPTKKPNKGTGLADIDLNSPSKLGFEKVSISTPSKRNTKRQLVAAKKNEQVPSKEAPVRRMSTRKSKIVDTAVFYDELEELLAPIIDIKFSDLSTSKPATPKKTMNKVATVPKTPSSQMKLIRNGDITPTMHNRFKKVVAADTPLNIVKEKLHVSYIPKALPCREKEYADIYNFVEGKLMDGCGGCMYISGVPGTGKTATVSEVIRQLQAAAKKRQVPDFIYVSINGMRLTEPRQAYVEILKQLTGKTHGWEQAHSTLEGRFTKAKSKKEAPIVLLVDELDILCTRRQDVVYNLLDWPTKAKSQLIVITIANTMDLPERLLMGRVTSRLGLTRLTFQAYTHKQLQEIVMKRLMGTDAFNPDAVQLVSRKVASVSGDARRALDICRRSAEIAELEGEHVLVSMQHVDEALNSMITQPKVRAIKRCSRLEQLVLQAIAAEVERTGVDETTFSDVYTMLSSVAGIDGFRMVSVTLALSAVRYLAACRLLLTDLKSADLHQRIILNVSADDIYYALRRD